MNERKTENIVREHFKKFDNLIIEEQKSDNPKINKLLKTASKKGTKQGYPDFIISFKNNPDFLIVIETKADIKKHKSKNLDKYDEYAVDGANLYASFLSKEYDVLAIGASGENEKELKVSHYLFLKNSHKPIPIFGDKLLTAEDYLKGYLQNEEKFKQDYEKLLEFTKKLNEKFHSEKILESQRSLLLSAILISLENKAFKKAYKEYDIPKELAEYLFNTTINELKKSNLDSEKIEILSTQFAFIKTDTSLTKKENVLKNFIEEIDKNINTFLKTHKYYDVLGQMYIEFLRYANADKGLGIVLTPPHITELFTELAQVNKNSIVYDNCTGTGGFLISAMKKMIEDAKGDNQKIKEIKKNQLLGVEYQAHIYALAVSNMYIHGDGKTSIELGDCFNEEIIKKVKNKKPNIGFLNPPYKADKKKDKDELEFVLNNLECLSEGGICIAIVPMQCALATKGKTYELKEKLLKNHTLEAVLSMPDELFFNSKVSVNTCVMIFTAHKPHPPQKEVFFGYYKNDGFVKRKNLGRVDYYNKWPEIKKEWVEYFINKKEKDGLSITKKITAKDEWVAEAYMKTDYSNLKEEDFEETLHSYLTFLFSSKILKNIQDKPSINKKFNLNIAEWKEFKLNELFTIKGTKTTPKEELEFYGKGKYPYVTTQATNNGVAGFYNYYTEVGNVITVDSAVIGYAAYQALPFSASDHVEKLIPKFKLNPYIAMFLVTILNKEQYRFNYGRKCSQSRLKKLTIKLPVKENEPDWEFMENYIKSLPYSKNLTLIN
jgi:type I restriction enzyme M protein